MSIKTKLEKLTVLQVATLNQPIRPDLGYGPIETVIYNIDKGLHSLGHRSPYLEWCGRNALPSGVLAEQVHPVDSSPLSVSPLTWSHSAFVWTVLKYIEKFNSLKNNNGV
jgi:hypothetical protein